MQSPPRSRVAPRPIEDTPVTDDASSPTPGVRLTVWVERARPCQGAVAYDRLTLRLPAEQVLSQGIGTLAEVAEGPQAPPPQVRRAPHKRGRWAARSEHLIACGAHSQGFQVESPGGSVYASLLVADTPAALGQALDALEEIQHPDLARLRGAKDRRRERHNDLLVAALNAHERSPFHGPWAGGSVVCRTDQFLEAYPIELTSPRGERARARPLDTFPPLALRAPATLQVRGYTVPRQVWIVPATDEERSLIHDGQRLLGARRCRVDVPESLLAALDAAGSVVPACSEAVLPAAHLRARCLVRVPPRADADALVPSVSSLRSPRRRALRTPALVRPSTDPVTLSLRLPVIDDPTLALWVHQRVVRGVYVPNDAHPRRLRADDVNEDEEWLVLCDAGGL
jgi:hypothetical protein